MRIIILLATRCKTYLGGQLHQWGLPYLTEGRLISPSAARSWPQLSVSYQKSKCVTISHRKLNSARCQLPEVELCYRQLPKVKLGSLSATRSRIIHQLPKVKLNLTSATRSRTQLIVSYQRPNTIHSQLPEVEINLPSAARSVTQFTISYSRGGTSSLTATRSGNQLTVSYQKWNWTNCQLPKMEIYLLPATRSENQVTAS